MSHEFNDSVFTEFADAMLRVNSLRFSVSATPIAWQALLSLVQLAFRHPNLQDRAGHAAACARTIADDIERRLAELDPVIARVCAAGWQAEHDVPLEPEKGNPK